MSFRRACLGCRPRATARPPQNGSTYLRSAFASHIVLRFDTSQRFPPAHFKGGLDIFINSERTVGAALRGRPAWNSISANGRVAQNGIPRRAATEGRPYSTFGGF